MESGPVLVIGGLNIDTLARVGGPGTDLRTSNPGTVHRSAGGVGRNVAEALARLGTPVSLVSAIGDDDAGESLLDGLATAGVDTTRVVRSAQPTGSYTAIFDDDGNLVIGVADTTAIEELQPDDLDPAWFSAASWVILDGNLRRKTISRAVQLARNNKVPAIVDPVGTVKAGRLGTMPGLHTFTPTLEELNAWSSAADPITHAHAQGISVVWVRQGAKGSTLYPAGEEPIPLQLPPAPIVNVTGAGDTTLAGYVHRLREGATLREAGWFAATAGWLAVGASEAVRPDLSVELVEQTWKDLTS